MRKLNRALKGLGLVPALLIILVACGGGGGGGGGGPTAPAPPINATISFSPAGGPGSNSVFLSQGSSGSTLVLEVRASQVSSLYGISFDLVYPSNLIAWQASPVTEGQFLSNNGSVRTELLITEQPPGTLIVGHSRLGNVGGVSGSGLHFTIQFTPRAVGQGGITFRNNSAFNPSGNRLSGVSWVGGTVTVQ